MAWAAYLRTEHPTLLFRSATAFLPLGPDVTIQSNKKGKAKVSADDGLGVDSVVAYLSEAARAKNDDKPLVVAVLGLTNVWLLFSRNETCQLIASLLQKSGWKKFIY